MKFILFLFLFFCAFMIVYGFYALFVFVGWIDEPQPPDKPPEPLNEPVNIALPAKVNMMEWDVSGKNTTILTVEDINSNIVNLN